MNIRTAFTRIDQYFGEEVKIPLSPTSSMMAWKVSKNLIIVYYDGMEEFRLYAYSDREIQFGENAPMIPLIDAKLKDTFDFIQRVSRIVKDVEGKIEDVVAETKLTD